MDTIDPDRAARDVMGTFYGFVCFVTVAWMTLAEQFADLPGVVVAFASGWYILRH